MTLPNVNWFPCTGTEWHEQPRKLLTFIETQHWKPQFPDGKRTSLCKAKKQPSVLWGNFTTALRQWSPWEWFHFSQVFIFVGLYARPCLSMHTQSISHSARTQLSHSGNNNQQHSTTSVTRQCIGSNWHYRYFLQLLNQIISLNVITVINNW